MTTPFEVADDTVLPQEAQPGMQALQRGLAILDLVGSFEEPVRFTALLEASGLPKGTLHRILRTLCDARYLALDEANQTYRLGSRPFQLAHRVWDQFDLRGAARPELQRLAELSQEAVRLGIIDGSEVLYIDQCDVPRQVRLSNGVGARFAIHATALGKAIAAYMPRDLRQQMFSEADLKSFTDHTIIQPSEIDRQLNIIKARGYAISIGEQHADVSAVAAPVLDHRARPIGAVGIVGPSYRLGEEVLHSYGREVIEAARRISGNIGELAMSIAVNPRPLDTGKKEVRVAFPGQDFLGEGPFWDTRSARLHWVDILAPSVISGDPVTGERSVRPLPELIGVAIPRESDGFVCATETGIKTLSSAGRLDTVVEPEADRPGNRFNDGKCDARGRLWVGSLAINTEPDKGQLWRVDVDGTATVMETGLHIANGLGWSPDSCTFYFTDSGKRTIWAYDFDVEAGTISGRRPFVRLEPEEGVPDGMAVDSEGGVWSALWDAWQVRRYRPDGKLDRTVPLPVPRPTSCAFGGPDLKTLFITTARIRLSARHLEEAPLSGSVLAVDIDVPGQAEHRFAG